MDRLGLCVAMLSRTAPGIAGWQGTEQAGIARRVNEFAADVARRHPERFGFFATPPLGDVAAAIDEVQHAFDALGADDVVLLSNHHGRYVGEPHDAPL